MGYLTIKDFHKDKIQIYDTKLYYSLSYKLDYTSLSSVSLELKDIFVNEDNGYYISITNKESIRMLTELDNYLMKHIKHYKCILHKNEDTYYLFLKKNDYLDDYMNKLNSSNITINIIKLKKTTSHTFPIIYVL